MKKIKDMAPEHETRADLYGMDQEMKSESPHGRLKKRSKRGMKRHGRRKGMR